MVILAGVPENNRGREFQLGSARQHRLAVAVLLLLHLCIWLAWPRWRQPAQSNDQAGLEISWIRSVKPAPHVAEADSVKFQPAKVVVPVAPKPRRTLSQAAPLSPPGTVSTPVTAAEPRDATPESSGSQTADPLAVASPLDLDQLRGAARQLGKQQKPDTIAQIQESHRRDQRMETQLGQNVAKAAKKDCLKAYSGIGLLAVIPLAVSTVVDTGCKW